jgi:hypothetical protein
MIERNVFAVPVLSGSGARVVGDDQRCYGASYYVVYDCWMANDKKIMGKLTLPNTSGSSAGLRR